MLSSTPSDQKIKRHDAATDPEQSHSSRVLNWEKGLLLLTILLTMTIADSPRILLWIQHYSARQTVSVSLVISAHAIAWKTPTSKAS